MPKTITLEMSLKPFKEVTPDYIRTVCELVFTQWKPFVKEAKTVTVMLWTADGSELLDYKGDMNEAFEWCRFVGGANPREHWDGIRDPERVGLHARNYDYIENPPVMTYGILKLIIAELKAAGKKILGEGYEIEVGETFDPGPEFAVSSFKYERHNEICLGQAMGQNTMVCANSTLNGDSTRYAAFPDGIPHGLPFGTFFGKQCQVFLTDMGFDYIWMSNGLGFGRETWSTVGACFDGERFHCDALDEVKDDVFSFWTLFRNECSYPIRTRGTNMSLGIDMATDGVPLAEIYKRVPDLLPPPNSPWAALDGDFGLELAGYMSRIAELPPENRYLYRFYIHDPWWVNSPWYDRYQGQPHDIYMPLACGRIDEKGKVHSPTDINILTVDTTFGELPESCANEPIPHLLKALKDAPDEASPAVWVYPFREYSECREAHFASEIFAGDWFIRGAINNGFPLSSVVSTDNFIKVPANTFAGKVLMTPVPKEAGFEKAVTDYIKQGGKVIFYGSLTHASESFRQFVGAVLTDSAEGEFPLTVDGKPHGTVKHTSLVCGGALDAISANAFAMAGKYAVGIAGQNFVWLRGTVSADYRKGARLLVPHDDAKYTIFENLTLAALAKLGTVIRYEKEPGQRSPVIMLSKSDNALMLSSYLPSTTVKTSFKFPLGAPVFIGTETKLENGFSTYHFPKASHLECRAFVEQESGILSATELPPVSYPYRRRVRISGLQNATVRVFGETYCKDRMQLLLNSHVDIYCVGDAFEGEYHTDENGTYYEARNLTGSFVFSMPRDKN